MRFGQQQRDRLRSVEDAQRQLARGGGEALERLAGQAARIAMRLAITVNDPVTATYPAANTNPNTYWIKFVDATFDNSDDGQQTLTTNNRQATAPTVTRNLGEAYIPVGTKLWVFQYQERWYTSRNAGEEIAVFYLNVDLDQDGSASATRCEWDGDSWEPGGGAPETVFDLVGAAVNSVANDKVICWRSSASSRWEVIECRGPLPIYWVYLNTNLAKGGSASANIVSPPGGDFTITWTPVGAPLTIYDTAGRFGPAKQGRRAAILYVPAGNFGIVISVDKQASTGFLYYTVYQDFDYGTVQFLVEPTSWWGVDEAPDSPLLVQNVGPPDDDNHYVFKGKTGARGMATFDADNNLWRNVWTECPQEAVNEPSSQTMADPITVPPADGNMYFPGAAVGWTGSAAIGG